MSRSMLMRRGSGRPVVAKLGRELLAASGGRVAPAACSAPVATAAADGDMEEAEVVVGPGVADPTASLPVSGAWCGESGGEPVHSPKVWLEAQRLGGALCALKPWCYHSNIRVSSVRVCLITSNCV